MASEKDGGWWTDYFDLDFLRLYEPLLVENTPLEVEGVLALLDVPPGARVLDFGCGWGRHALELARAGLSVTGVDLSEPLLAEARRRAAAERVSVDYVRADLRHIGFQGEFDAVVSLFSSLGYFPDPADDLAALRCVRRALRPGGYLLLETMHRDQVAREFLERDWWEGPEGEHVWVERDFDAVDGVSREWLRWRGPGGEGEKYHEIRIRSASEWAALLAAADLTPEEWFGDWDLSPLTHRSERLLVLARRA